MNRKEKFETLGTYIIFVGTMIPVFLKNVSAIIWVIIVGIGVGLMAIGYRNVKENNE